MPLTTDNTGLLLIVWLVVLAIILFASWKTRNRSVGLILAYCFQLWLLYWLGGFIHFIDNRSGKVR